MKRKGLVAPPFPECYLPHTVPPVGYIQYAGVERRARQRFPVDSEARYRLLYGQHLAETGTARVLNMSSSGVWLATDRPLTPGLPVEISMSWPALLNGTCPLKLTMFGCVVRAGEGGAAVAIERHEFRTQSRRASGAMA
jgi:hypothetical protein